MTALVAHSPHEGLSRRQLEVLQYMWDGLHSKMIGEKMGLNSKGVEYHSSNTFGTPARHFRHIILSLLKQG